MTSVASIDSGDPTSLLRHVDALEEAGRLSEAIVRLQELTRSTRDPAGMRRLIRLRRRAFERAEPRPDLVSMPVEEEPECDPETGLAVARPGTLSAALVRAGIEKKGSLLVRGLFDAPTVARLRSLVDRAFESRDRFETDGIVSDGYDELEDVPFGGGRHFTKEAGVLAADSPLGFFELLEEYERRGILRMVESFLGERPALSVEKTVLRRIPRLEASSWHQDGKFLGEHIRALNVWVALSRCGRTAPGLEMLPCRVARIMKTGAYFDWDIHPQTIRDEFPGVPTSLPELEPGDTFFFDHLCVHRTGLLPGMTDPRYALESWFFAPSAYPPVNNSTGLLV